MSPHTVLNLNFSSLELRADDRHHFGQHPHHHFNGSVHRHHPLHVHDPSMAMIERSLNPLADASLNHHHHPAAALTTQIAELEQLRRSQCHNQESPNATTHPNHPFTSLPSGMRLFRDGYLTRSRV